MREPAAASTLGVPSQRLSGTKPLADLVVSSHNGYVRYSRTTWFFALVALIWSAFASPAVAMWQCEGRDCGITPWACCCESPAAEKDANCDQFTQASAGSENCPTDCNCTMVVRGTDGARETAASVQAPVVSPVVLLPSSSPFVAPRALVIASAMPDRGPPVRNVALLSPALRAPPTPDVSPLRL